MHGTLYITTQCLVIRPGSVLKPKPRFWGKTEPKPKARFWQGSKSVLKRTRRTEGVAHSLNDAVFKLLLTGLLNDSQCNVGGHSRKVYCQHLSDRANKLLHNGRPSSRRRPW